jgi:uncharacterized protein (DUF433 family)
MPALRRYTNERGGEALSHVYKLAPGVTAQWDVMSGTPCIQGRRLPTAQFAGMFAAGDSVAHLAEEFRLEPVDVENAIRYEYLRRMKRHPEFRAKRPK